MSANSVNWQCRYMTANLRNTMSGLESAEDVSNTELMLGTGWAMEAIPNIGDRTDKLKPLSDACAELGITSSEDLARIVLAGIQNRQRLLIEQQEE